MHFLIDKIVEQQPQLQLVHTCITRITLSQMSLNKNTVPWCFPIHCVFLLSNLVQIQSWHRAIKPKLGKLLGVTASKIGIPTEPATPTTVNPRFVASKLNLQGLIPWRLIERFENDSKLFQPPKFRHLFTLLLHLFILSSKFLTKDRFGFLT